MPIDLTCTCGKQLRVANEFAGRQGKCPICGQLLDIPEPDVGTAPGPAPLDAAQAITASPERAHLPQPESPSLAITPRPTGLADLDAQDQPITRPPYKLFSPRSIALVAFLMGPVGPFILLTLNYSPLGRRPAAWITAAVGVLTLAGLVGFFMVLPENTPGLAIGVPLFLAMWGAAYGLQGAIFEKHLKEHGEPASGWAAAGIGLLGILIYFAILLGAAQAVDMLGGFGNKIDFGNNEEIYYGDGATAADAQALGAFLRERGFFDGKGGKSVRVRQEGNRMVISFVVQDWVLKDSLTHQQFRELGDLASRRAFNGRPVDVELCDSYFAVKKKL